MTVEQLRVYQAAEQLVVEVDLIAERLPFSVRNTVDHMIRCAEAVLFNVAEGGGSFKPKVKANAYDVARKEAQELRATLRRLVLKRVITTEEITKAYDLAGAIIAMLTRMILNVESRES